MKRIADLSVAPLALFEHDPQRLVLALPDGLAMIEKDTLTYLDHGPVEGAAQAPDRSYYCTRGDRIVRLDLERRAAPEDVTARFSGRPQGRRQVVCTGDGDLWVEGCTTRLLPNGRFAANPAAVTAEWAPVAHEADIYGNRWTLAEGPRGRQVLVAPASAPEEWRFAGLASGDWRFLISDSVGYVWVAGPDGWQRYCPRLAETGWQTVARPMPESAVTAVGRSPADLVMAAFADGSLLELDATAAGDTVVRSLGTTPSPGQCVLTDRRGAVWVATGEGLYRREPAADAWQRTWEEKRGRLPGGGNHDIFAAACQGRLYVAGGWAGQWGLPVRDHVPDELLAYDPRTECWEAISRMYMPRRYNGIAALDDRVWVVGGETRFAGRGGPHQALYLVDVYDPTSNTWSAGPSLNHVRTDPFVVTCNGRIWAIGGARHNGGPALDTVESIGPGEGAWRIETPLPWPTRQGHGCALDGVIYCFSIDGAFALDTQSGQWDEAFPQPGEIGQGPLAAAWKDEVWLIGGYGDRGIRCFNPKSRTWRPGPDLPTEQAWAAAAVLDDRLFIIGGAHYTKPHEAIVFDDRTYVLRPGIG